MKRRLTIGFLAVLCAASAAHAQTYRWVDPATGRTMFSDQPPPPGARQAGQVGSSASGGERAQPYSVRVAAERFPVTLYTAPDCGNHCQRARDLLNGRGVPFAEKMVGGDNSDLQALKQLTGGDAYVPVVLIGQQHIKGFQAGSWNNLLDLAGYPKQAPFGSRPMPIPTPPASPSPSEATSTETEAK